MSRCVYVHPAGTRTPDETGAPYEVPPRITDERSLWAWIKDVCAPDVVEVHTALSWCRFTEVPEFPLNPTFILHVRRAPPAPSSPVSSTLTNLCDDAATKASELIAAHGATLTLEALSDPTQTSTITFLEDIVAVDMIGRACMGDLIEFIRESTQDLNFVLGPASCGKTYCVRAASLFLFLEFASSGQGRLMYVDGDEFSRDPADALVRSFALAYHDSNDALDQIESLKDVKDATQVMSIMQKSVLGEEDRRLYLVLDGGPEISADNECRLRTIARFGAVILCGKWQQYLKNRGREFFIDGAFNDAEVTSFLAFLKCNDTKESIWWSTGWVPGMIVTRIEQEYRDALKKYIRGLSDEEVPRFSSLISTGEVDDDEAVVPEQATGLFYRGANGSLRCLSEKLRSYASIQLMLQDKLADQKVVDSLIRQWMRTAVIGSGPGDTGIGVNAEQACILVARYKNPKIRYAENEYVDIAPVSVRHFRKTFRLTLTEPTLFLPVHGNEKELECYYVTDSHFVVIQFATGVEDHTHTRPRAEELFISDAEGGGGRKKYVLAWVVYCKGRWFERKTIEREGRKLSYHEVYLNFECFDQSLAVIDKKLWKLRGGKYTVAKEERKHRADKRSLATGDEPEFEAVPKRNRQR